MTLNPCERSFKPLSLLAKLVPRLSGLGMVDGLILIMHNNSPCSQVLGKGVRVRNTAMVGVKDIQDIG